VMGLNRSLATYHNPGHWEVKWRFFEAAACGCLNISARCKLLDGLGYLPYEHYMPVAAPEDETGDPWPSVEDLAAVIRELKSKPSLWRNMATRAREHTLRKHTYYHRCAQVAKDLDMKPLGKMTERAIDMMLVEEKLKWKSTLDLTGD
ncbi:MAG: glycosyltransferase, partial [Candidatus Uhrbacteria bacterium]|nr:glycosyltransferase [Candidatus Uhrbacteria bacterium]